MFGVDDIAGGLLKIGGQLIDRLWPDPTEAAKMKLQLFEAQQKGDLAELNAELSLMVEQAKTNQLEAQNPNLFVSGWRPCIGWVCAGLIVWSYLGAPLLHFFLPDKPLPALPVDALFELVLAMLGVAGLRTAEKWKGVAAK